MVRIPKRYGQSRDNSCHFCGAIATSKSEQGLVVCHKHVTEKTDEIKCTCGSWLDLRSGKWGSYYNCINCGNVNMAKAMQMKEMTRNKAEVTKKWQEKKERATTKEITIDSNDAFYFS